MSWSLGHKATMDAEDGTPPWIEVCERDSAKIFNAYLPPILMGDLALGDFGNEVLSILTAELEQALRALDVHEEHEVEWNRRDDRLALRFMRKA